MRLEFKLGGANNDHITNSYMASGGDEGYYVGGTAFIKEDVVYKANIVLVLV